jgi:hypothetical protein
MVVLLKMKDLQWENNGKAGKKAKPIKDVMLGAAQMTS